MREHSEEIISPYKLRQVYNMVADVEKYPEFIPWCKAVRISDKAKTSFVADLLVSFAAVSESYTSRVHLLKNEINIEYIKGPFSVLENRWKFTPIKNGTKIDFYIKFQFRSKLLQGLIGGLFEKACHKMVGAFEQRAKELYG